MKVLGISRSLRFSPNSAARDAAIFNAVVGELRRKGHEVTAVCEDDFSGVAGHELVFSMARGEETLRGLSEAEAAGLPVVNSATALLRGTRTALSAVFAQAGLPVAPNVLVDGGMAGNMVPGKRYWLKRGDACAQSANDVRPVASAEELAAALEDFSRRGIRGALLSEHVAGDLVKFYGVEGTNFFYTYYPTAKGAFSKFGLERFNGRPTGFAFDAHALKADADRAAVLSGFVVYGGDCIVRPDGTYLIIDFNDWPSFSLCRMAAAKAIVQRLMSLSAACVCRVDVTPAVNRQDTILIS